MNMKRCLPSLFIGAICSCLLSCGDTDDNTDEVVIPITYVAPQEYSVYSALIEELFMKGREDSIPETFVIRDHTSASIFVMDDGSPDSTMGYVCKKMPNLEKETLDDFLTRNGQSYPLESQFQVEIPYTFISEEEQSEIFTNERAWDEFYEKYPESQGIMILSRVGFNRRADQAFVFMGNQSHWLAGSGLCILLDRIIIAEKGEAWVVQNEVLVWVS